MQNVSLQEMLNMHSYLTSLSHHSKKMKEVLDKLEDQIHETVMSLKKAKYE